MSYWITLGECIRSDLVLLEIRECEFVDSLRRNATFTWSICKSSLFDKKLLFS